MVHHVSLYVGDRAYTTEPFVWRMRMLYRGPMVWCCGLEIDGVSFSRFGLPSRISTCILLSIYLLIFLIYRALSSISTIKWLSDAIELFKGKYLIRTSGVCYRPLWLPGEVVQHPNMSMSFLTIWPIALSFLFDPQSNNPRSTIKSLCRKPIGQRISISCGQHIRNNHPSHRHTRPEIASQLPWLVKFMAMCPHGFVLEFSVWRFSDIRWTYWGQGDMSNEPPGRQLAFIRATTS